MTGEIPESEIREHEIRLMDKYLESIYVYWSALLTINGLMLTLFSIDALSANERSLFLTYMLIGSCALSLLLLIWNFRTIKTNYYKLGKMSVDDMPDVQADERKTAAKQRNRLRRESAVEVLLIAETLLIVLIIITK